MNRTKKIIAVSAAAATLGLAAVAGPGIAAEIGSQTAAPSTTERTFQQELADRIGVPADKVGSALEEMRGEREADHMTERLDDMVEDRELTREQADAITAQIASGDVEGARTALRTAMVEAEAEELIADGTITQTQADQVIALAQDGVPVELDDDEEFGKGKRHGGDRDHHDDRHGDRDDD